MRIRALAVAALATVSLAACAPSGTATPSPAAPITTTASAAPTTPPVPRAAVAPSTQQTYTVVRGDTLSAIARKYSTTVANLQSWNDLGTSTLIRVGQVLKVSVPAPAPTPTTPAPAPTTQTLGVGGVATPTNALALPPVTNGKSSVTASGVYDCKGATVKGWVNVKGDNITIQNCVIDANYQYGVVTEGTNNTIQNNQIKNIHAPGDLNVITFYGNGTRLLFNLADNAVTGNPGDSHTDFAQSWVSKSHFVASDDVEIRGNSAVGPANPDRLNSVPNFHQFLVVEDYNRGGNSGGNTDGMKNWRIIGNRIGCSWNQDIKNDGVDGMIVSNNDFVGSSDHAMQQASGSGLQFFSSNKVGPDYGNTGVPITEGAGPA